jgi:aryl-alcohol dehydrogenase-like predicted oxidoreductase
VRSQIVQQLAQQALASQTFTRGTGVPRRPFGRAAESVSLLCLGGWHVVAKPALEKTDESESIRIMHAAIDLGVDFFDNAWEYHNGYAEEAMGRALAIDGKRKQVFLMTKNCERDYEGSLRHLEQSLRRFQTDYLDLWQFHELSYDNDPEWLFERGAVRAAVEAQQAGKVRHIGFTGHKDPRIHLKALGMPHAWDACQMPINVMDSQYRSFLNQVVPVAREKGVAAIGMKSFGGGWPRGRVLENMNVGAADMLGFALSQPVTSQVVGITTMEQLQFAVEIARTIPMPEEAQSALMERVRVEAGDGRYESFKSTNEHDGPHHRRQHEFALART